jgi:hypothetical protein
VGKNKVNRVPDSANHKESLEKLQSWDRYLVSNTQYWLSLNPSKEQPTPLFELAEKLVENTQLSEQMFALWSDGIIQFSQAVQKHFPDNIFWDLDQLGAVMFRMAAQQTELSVVQQNYDLLVSLLDLFGRYSVVRFRYIHDFIYGFDWAKWVNRAPDERSHIKPFDAEFSLSMQKRGFELLDLIANDDQKYPKLRDRNHRNPFGFSREPEAEIELHRELARQNYIPVRAWCSQDSYQWDQPFAELRHWQACLLGLNVLRLSRSCDFCSSYGAKYFVFSRVYYKFW